MAGSAKLIRVAAATIALSGAYYGLKVKEEGFTSAPVIPVQGDRPTIGFGSTFYEDGKPVKMGDPAISRDRGWKIVAAHNAREEADFRATLDGVTLFQPEYELFFDWRYQYGISAWRNGGILRNLKTGNRVQACKTILEYKFMTSARAQSAPGWQVTKRDGQGRAVQWRYDCSTPGNKVCYGVHGRNLRRYDSCMSYAPLNELPPPPSTLMAGGPQ